MKNNTTKAPLILATLNADGDEIPFRRGASPVTSNVTQQTTIIATLDEQGNPIPISMSEIDDFTTEDKAKLDKLGEDPETGAPTWNGEPIDDTSKADRAVDAVEGNFAALDADGNPTDSGKKPTDFLEVNDYKPQIIVDTFNDLPTDKIPGTEARVLTSIVSSTTGVVTSLEEGDILDAVEISETMALVGNPVNDVGLCLFKEGSAGYIYQYILNLEMHGSTLVFCYDLDVTTGEGDDIKQHFVYTPEACIGTGDYEAVEFSAGWNLVERDGGEENDFSASSVLFSEVPLIENGVTVEEVGSNADLVYPYLQITVDTSKPEGRYILNSSSTWVLLDYASRQLVDTKVDKARGKVLSTYDFTENYKNKLERIYDHISSVTDIDLLPSNILNMRFVFVDGVSDPSTRGLYYYQDSAWKSLASLDEVYTTAPGTAAYADSFEVVEGTLYESVITAGFTSYDTDKYVYSIKPVPSAANTDLYFAKRMYLRRITETDAYVGCEGDPGTGASVQLIIMRQLRKDQHV